MELTEQQMMLLEQLTYIDIEVSNEAGVDPNTEAKTVEELLSPFFESIE